jgi:hypothetical protein
VTHHLLSVDEGDVGIIDQPQAQRASKIVDGDVGADSFIDRRRIARRAV